MNEPKQKAEEIVRKMGIKWKSISVEFGLNEDLQVPKNQYAKQCALIAIDELIDFTTKVIDNEISGIYAIYLEQVKKEIEKL